MLSVKEAQQKIIETVKPLVPVEVSLYEAVGLVLAGDMISDVSLPPFDNSAMDGFAVKASDLSGASENASIELKVVMDIPAGSFTDQVLQSGEAARIMTGAPVPAGADSVVRVEDTEPSESSVKVKKSVKEGANIRRQGEDIARGSVVLTEGRKIYPGDVGLLAAIGKGAVKVHSKPNVAIISTGDELLEPGTPLGPGKIYNSNAYMLSALLHYYGANPVFMGIAEDKPEALEEKLEQASQYDLILTSGGVSVGVYDLVKDILSKMGTMFFWQVAIRPGKPLAFGLVKGTPLLGLPGNPGSSFVSFYQFVLPAIKRLAGNAEAIAPVRKAKLAESIKKKKGLKYCVRVRLSEENGELTANLSGGQSSGMLGSLALADALALLPEEKELVDAGESVDIQMLY